MVRQPNILKWAEWPQMTLKQQIVQRHIKYLTPMPNLLSTAMLRRFFF